MQFDTGTEVARQINRIKKQIGFSPIRPVLASVNPVFSRKQQDLQNTARSLARKKRQILCHKVGCSKGENSILELFGWFRTFPGGLDDLVSDDPVSKGLETFENGGLPEG